MASTDDIENGAKLLITDIDDMLKTAKMTAVQRLSLKAHRYSLLATIETRVKFVAIEKRMDKIDAIVFWPQRHPWGAVLLLAAINAWFVGELRNPILAALAAGIMDVKVLLGL